MELTNRIFHFKRWCLKPKEVSLRQLLHSILWLNTCDAFYFIPVPCCCCLWWRMCVRERKQQVHNTKTRTCEYVAQEQLKLRGLYIVGSWTRCPTYSGWDGWGSFFWGGFLSWLVISWRHSWLLRAKMRGFFFCGTEGGLGRTGILLLRLTQTC